MDDIGAVLHVSRAASGTVSRRQFMSSITIYFGDKLLLLHIEGYESVVGFKASHGQFIKIAKKNNSYSEDDELENLVRRFATRLGRHLGLGTTISVNMFVTRSLRAPVLLFLNWNLALYQEAPSPSCP